MEVVTVNFGELQLVLHFIRIGKFCGSMRKKHAQN
jgi:hypothetical protein